MIDLDASCRPDSASINVNELSNFVRKICFIRAIRVIRG
jgi:hypothetical protein